MMTTPNTQANSNTKVLNYPEGEAIVALLEWEPHKQFTAKEIEKLLHPIPPNTEPINTTLSVLEQCEAITKVHSNKNGRAVYTISRSLVFQNNKDLKQQLFQFFNKHPEVECSPLWLSKGLCEPLDRIKRSLNEMESVGMVERTNQNYYRVCHTWLQRKETIDALSDAIFAETLRFLPKIPQSAVCEKIPKVKQKKIGQDTFWDIDKILNYKKDTPD